MRVLPGFRLGELEGSEAGGVVGREIEHTQGSLGEQIRRTVTMRSRAGLEMRTFPPINAFSGILIIVPEDVKKGALTQLICSRNP
jgi:hypothetical protein